MADSESKGQFEAFKVPQLLSHKESVNESKIDCQSNNETTSECIEMKSEQNKNSENAKAKTDKQILYVPFPYTEPTWGAIPSPLYSFEIIKNGTFIETYNIQTSLLTFGRLDVCDMVFEHPSVSRYHAVIQYCQGDTSHSKGFYLYDLGSTHGTFLNKERITPKIYYKLKVGYVLKFGGSTRLHILQGPEEQDDLKPQPPKVEEDICTWGIGEDAEEEEDLSENPFALSTPNEELYLEDPKKTLRGWFQREGYELEYDVEEKGFKTFLCRIKLPIDTPTGDFMPVEASVSGKKKEAVVACALEACRTLDRLGLLRQSHHESRQRKKKKWEENDYYDSDEDTFLDRTGTIEKKREMRKRIEKKPEAETFESIEDKLKIVMNEINEIKNKLTVSKTEIQCEKNAEDDSLEAYMSTLTNITDRTSDKIERRKLSSRLIQAGKEKAHLEKLLEIARPTKLPPVVKYPGMIGKKLKSKLQKPVLKIQKNLPICKLDENEEEVDEESDSESMNSDNVSKPTDSSNATVNTKENIKETKSYNLIMNVSARDNEAAPSPKHKLEIIDTFKEELKELKKPKKMVEVKDLSSHKKRKKENQKQVEQNIDVYATESAEYSTWVPPSDQTGDGITYLNAKYGY